MCYTATAFMHENYKASKTGTKKEAKNASSFIDVGVMATFLPECQLKCVNWEFLASDFWSVSSYN